MNIRRVAVALGALMAAAGAVAQPVPSLFTYQGKLTDNGQAANGQYDLYFRLYSTDTGIFPLGSAVTLDNVQVVNGVFTVKLDFGQGLFNGDPRWIAISVRPGAQTGAYTVLSPRQEITPAPHAIVASTLDLPLRAGDTTNPDLYGPNALLHLTQAGTSPAIRGETSGDGTAVEAIHTATSGILYGVYGETHSTSGRGVFGHAVQTAGSQAFGVHGQTESSTSGASGMRAVANGGGSSMTYGILAQSNSSAGVGSHGQGRYGVYGLGTTGGIDAIGVLGITSQADGVGVNGRATGGGGSATGVLGQAPAGGWAGFFEGDVRVAGLMWANDKNFLIDNPANPANEFLVHACIESDERRNLYDGVVSLDANGTATVQLPSGSTNSMRASATSSRAWAGRPRCTSPARWRTTGS
jgi:hypothetical protein